MGALAKTHESLSTVREKVNWQYVKKGLSLVLFLLLAFLLVSKARELEWQKIWSTFIETKVSTLVVATLLGFACYTAYASYDLIGRHLFKIDVKRYKALTAAWISYACNLNFGALVGSVALRYRLYSRLGVPAVSVTKILGVSVFSNWTGYVLLAGVLFVSGAFTPPESWALGTLGFRLLGAGFVILVTAYIGLCAFSKKREYGFRGKTLELPPINVAAWQLGTAIVHWSLMAAVMHQFFAGDLSFATVYVALLVSCIAGAVSHVPGGLGVIEAVFAAMLAGEMPRHEIIAAVFAYRCVFYLIPLAATIPLYLVFETVLAQKNSKQ